MSFHANSGGDAFRSKGSRIFGAAFDAAWGAVEKSGNLLAGVAQAPTTRERLAKRIIEMGQKGERDYQRLVDDAFAHLTGTA